MAIFHLRIKHIFRSYGISAVENVAAITGTCLVDGGTKATIDKSKLEVDVFWETLLPEGSGIPKDDRSIWNKLENFEDEYATQRYKNLGNRERYINSARIAHAYLFVIPKELTRDQSIDLIRGIVKERFINRGMVATFAVIFKKGNPHTRIQVSHRAIDNKQNFSMVKVTRDLVSPNGMWETRKFFADKTNAFFESLGMTERVEHRSYTERGIDLIPTKHRGSQVSKLDSLGKASRITKRNEEIFAENKKRVIQNPKIILQELDSMGSLLDEKEIISLVKKRLDEDSGEIFDRVFSSVMQELKARGQYLEGGIVDTDKLLHPPIEKSVSGETNLVKAPIKRKAWWKILRK